MDNEPATTGIRNVACILKQTVGDINAAGCKATKRNTEVNARQGEAQSIHQVLLSVKIDINATVLTLHKRQTEGGVAKRATDTDTVAYVGPRPK
jgi:chorismate mutase